MIFSAVTQKLSTGPVVRQDFRQSVRMVMFETEYEEWRYATNGGTAFVVRFNGGYYGITCRHVLGSFEWKQLALSDTRFGKMIAGVHAIHYPSSPSKGAIGSDILDIAIIEFAADIDARFFNDQAYIFDSGTIGSSRPGDEIVVNGLLKDPTKIDGTHVEPVFGLIEFTDQDRTSDLAVRRAMGQYVNRQFPNLLGLSGSPVFNKTLGRLSGVAVRGGVDGDKATLYYVDIQDVAQILAGVSSGVAKVEYEKRVATLVKQRP